MGVAGPDEIVNVVTSHNLHLLEIAPLSDFNDSYGLSQILCG